MGPIAATAVAGGIAGGVVLAGLRFTRTRDSYLRGILIAVAAILAFEGARLALIG